MTENIPQSEIPVAPPASARPTREEEAKLALEHTVVSLRSAWVLVIFFLATIVSVPVFQHMADVAAARAMQSGAGEPGRKLFQPDDALGLLPTPAEFAAVRSGKDVVALLPSVKELKDYENALTDNSVIANWLLPRAQAGLTQLGSGNEKALVGRDGWLFYRPEVDYLTGPGFLDPALMTRQARSGGEDTTAMQPDPIRPIVQLQRQLAERGITLVVMPAPMKSMLEPEHLSGGYQYLEHPLQNPSYAQFVDALKAEGVHYFDVSQALLEQKHTTGRAQFLETDTHWTPDAMDLSARLLAEYLQNSGALPTQEPFGCTRKPQKVSNLGDIAEMLKLLPGQKLFRPQKVEIKQVFTPNGQPWTADRNADILLLGDSFVNLYSLGGMKWGEASGFSEQLSFYLQRPIDKIVQNAGGAFATRELLAKELKAGKDRLAGKKVVVYEFAMRELKDGNWRLIDLPKVTAKTATPVPESVPTPEPLPGTAPLPLIIAGLSPAMIDPSKDELTTLRLTLPEDAAYRVRIMDADDKLVRELAPNKQAHAGSYQHTWDGKDRRNSVVADGVYTVAVERTDVQLPRISALVTVKTAAAPTPDAPPVAPSSNLVLSGRIKAIAATPKPGTVPYKDCVVAIYLTNMTVTHGTLKDEEILVYTWGLRDNVQTKAANYHTGQTVTLSLTPWEKVSGKYDGYRRCEVADDNAIFLNAYWGE